MGMVDSPVAEAIGSNDRMLHCRIQAARGNLPCFVMTQAGRGGAESGAGRRLWFDLPGRAHDMEGR
jgi:hypothetical protein